MAQLVERDLAKVEAAGSSPVSRFSYALDFPGLFCMPKEITPGSAFHIKNSWLWMTDTSIARENKVSLKPAQFLPETVSGKVLG